MQEQIGERFIDLSFNFYNTYRVNRSQFIDCSRFVKNFPKRGNNAIALPVVLSPSQKRAVTAVITHLKGSSPDPLNLLVIGEGGVGKSVVIKAIKKELLRHGQTVSIASFTGTAAYGVHGVTLHSLLGLPLHAGSFKGLLEQQFIPARSTRQRLLETDYLIIDEVYLCGLHSLRYVDFVLRQIRDSDIQFGGIGVILTGDVAQLDCVADFQFFVDPEKLDEGLRETQEIYRSFTPIVLQENFRSEDAQYLQLLRNFRFKRVSDGNIALLETRLIDRVSEEERELFKDATRVFPTNVLCDTYARTVIRNIQKPILPLPAGNGTVEESLYVYEGARVQITSNLSVQAGLTNGRLAKIIKPIFYKKQTYPDFLILDVDGWTGPIVEGGVPVKPIVDPRTLKSQFPVRQALAQTLHKVQGRTLDKLVLHFTSREVFANYSYTGLSRVRNLNSILIGDNFLPVSRFRGTKDFQRGFEIQMQELIRLGVEEEEEPTEEAE